MKYFFTILFIMCFNRWNFAQANDFEEKLTQRQVITIDMIKAAGIQTLSDIFYLADKWDFYSIDGYEKGVSANSLSSFQRQNFLVMLDGQLIDDRIFDVQNINQIPISIDQVDYVVLINSPQIYNGEFTENGLIDIHTKTPAKGLSVRGYYGIGDQTGDPGPYVFTKDSTSNVDKLGYYLSGGASFSYNNWYAETATKIEQNFATDAEISSRVSNLYPDYNKARMFSSYYKFNLNILGGNQQIIAGSTRHSNFFFFKPYGDEIPVNRYFKHIGFNGAINSFQNFGLSYSMTYSTNEMNQWENKQDLNFNWQMENYYANLEGRYGNEFLSGAFGIGYKKIIGRNPSTLFDKEFELKKAYGRIDFKLSDNFIQSLDLFANNSNSASALKIAIRNGWDISSKSILRTSYTFSERLLIEDANYWFWNEQGYSFYAQGLYTPNVMGNYNTGKLYTFDINYKLNIDTSLNVEAGINYRHFSDYYVEEQSFQFNNNENTFFAPDEIFTGADLKVFGIQAGLEYKITSYLNQKIFYSLQKDIWGSRQFRDIWHELPEHKISYTINYEPARDFSIWTKLRYSSSTYWTDYKYSDSQSQSVYLNKVKPLFNVDLSMQKWLWDRRIWLNILFRNIFNQSENYTPIGVSADLRYYLSVQLFFNSVLK